jgi:death-on-curing protein
MKEPLWLTRLVVEAVHFDQIREHGGLHGLRDEGLLESALARSQHKWTYKRRPDLASLAAAYGYGLVRNHPFRDGNKRIAFLAMVVFLGLNGFDLDADEMDIVTAMVTAADGKLSKRQLAEWVRKRVSPRANR